MKSIEKYKGFFIGRYETGAVETNTPVVKRMNMQLDISTWYTIYNRMKNISNNENIHISIIWGSLLEETLQWLIDTGNKTYSEIGNNSTSWGNYKNATFIYKNTSGVNVTKSNKSTQRIPTGSTEYTNANNIYDLAGNVRDCSLESNNLTGRCSYGGRYNESGSSYPASFKIRYLQDLYLKIKKYSSFGLYWDETKVIILHDNFGKDLYCFFLIIYAIICCVYWLIFYSLKVTETS